MGCAGCRGEAHESGCGSGRRARGRRTWGTFARNHLAGTVAIDFLTVPTATFGVLYVFFDGPTRGVNVRVMGRSLVDVARVWRALRAEKR